MKFKFVACPDSKSSILYIYIFYEFWRDWCIWIFYRINRLICFKRKTGNQLQNSCGSDKTTVRLIYGIGYSFGAKVSKKLQVTPNKKMIHSTYRLLSVPSFGKEGERFANQAFVKEWVKKVWPSLINVSAQDENFNSHSGFWIISFM